MIINPNKRQVEAIKRAACAFQGGQARWETLARIGATEIQIIKQLNREFGLGGGSSGPGGIRESHKANPPRVWLQTVPIGDPDIQGMVLVDAIRHIFKIGLPGEEYVVQPELFD